MSTPPHVAAYRSRMPRTSGVPRRLPTTPSRSGSLLPARSANTIGRSGEANGAGRRVTLSGVSLGAIARSIAERVRPFGVDIWAYDPFLDPTEIQQQNVRAVSFDQLIEAADYLVIQAPLTRRPATCSIG